MLDTFGRQKCRKQYRRVVAAFERIFGSIIFFGTEESRAIGRLVRMVRFNF